MSFISKIKRVIVDRIVRIGIFKQPSIKYCVENSLLPSMFVQMPSNVVRKTFNIPCSEYQTQLNQDLFALLMNQFRSGFFIEIGANDGFTLSNTIYLEKHFGWQGILVEANNKYISSLCKRDKSIVVNKAISSQKGKANFIDAGLYGGLKDSLDERYEVYTRDANCITVDCMELQEILDKNGAPETIDFVSIDVEGGEVPIVEMMVSVDRRFRCGCIEYNNRIQDYRRMVELLRSGGYKVVWESQTGHDLFFVDSSVN